jgi:protease I
VTILSPHGGQIQSFHDLDLTFGERSPVTLPVARARAGGYDGLHLPGGVGNPDRLRIDDDAVTFVRQFAASGKPVGVICHGAWTLVEAGVVRGRTLTSWPSLRTGIRNAGGTWVDQEVAEDGNLVSSRKPDDIPAFSRKLISRIAGGWPAGPRSGRGQPAFSPAPPRLEGAAPAGRPWWPQPPAGYGRRAGPG